LGQNLQKVANIKAKKSYGQHFLINEAVAKKIAESLHRKDGGLNVLEVGPGKGVLTKYLIEQGLCFKAVEADRDMVDYLNQNLGLDESSIIFLDFLKLNAYKVFDGQPFYIIGNFPYNISSQIVFKMLKAKELVPEMVGMFQKEMADRIIAPPGNKVYGVISVLTQAFYSGEMLMKVSPGSFSPPPKVQSAVIRLTRRDNQELGCNEKLFRTIVKIAFGQRRKMLRNTMKSLVEESAVLEDKFFDQRPEQLSVQDFVQVTNLLEKYINYESGNESNGSPQGGDEI